MWKVSRAWLPLNHGIVFSFLFHRENSIWWDLTPRRKWMNIWEVLMPLTQIDIYGYSLTNMLMPWCPCFFVSLLEEQKIEIFSFLNLSALLYWRNPKYCSVLTVAIGIIVIIVRWIWNNKIWIFFHISYRNKRPFIFTPF